MPEYRRKNTISNTRDKLAAGPVTTGDFAASSSSNLTVDSEGAYDKPGELFPHNKINKSKDNKVSNDSFANSGNTFL
ncbi:hypothetical protein [Clostridium thermarum]|uniref:hypothetical protein n=1 Tax=Clostridium thermarum TaxID=1716543 RepID=UPI00111FB353|nr:hypothetical protein [Clostridium thermarum]